MCYKRFSDNTGGQSVSEMMTLDELFSQEEEKRLMKERAEIAKEMTDWNALPQEEKDHIMNERELMWEALEKAYEEDEDEEEEDTYENRMLFGTMWFGAPAYDTAKMFPEWFDAYMSASIGEASNSWLKDFCKVALKMCCHRG